MEHSNLFPDSFHRVTIKGLFVKDGKILLIKESPKITGNWELPGGGLDFGEDIQKGFAREIQEEMGLKVSKISKSPLYVWTHKNIARRNLEWYYSFVVAYRIEFAELGSGTLNIEYSCHSMLDLPCLRGIVSVLYHTFFCLIVPDPIIDSRQ